MDSGPVTAPAWIQIGMVFPRAQCRPLMLKVEKIMTAESNKLVMARFVDFINSASEKLASELIAPDAVFHVPGRAEPVQGPSGYLEIIEMMRGRLPLTPMDQSIDRASELLTQPHANADLLVSCRGREATDVGHRRLP